MSANPLVAQNLRRTLIDLRRAEAKLVAAGSAENAYAYISARNDHESNIRQIQEERSAGR